MPPYLPFAIPVGSGSVGWFADIRTGFLRELRDCSASAGHRAARILTFAQGAKNGMRARPPQSGNLYVLNGIERA